MGSTFHGVLLGISTKSLAKVKRGVVDQLKYNVTRASGAWCPRANLWIWGILDLSLLGLI